MFVGGNFLFLSQCFLMEISYFRQFVDGNTLIYPVFDSRNVLFYRVCQQIDKQPES